MFSRKDRLIKLGFTQSREVGGEHEVQFAPLLTLRLCVKPSFSLQESRIYIRFLHKSVNLWSK
jgi:hypothetical protein